MSRVARRPAVGLSALLLAVICGLGSSSTGAAQNGAWAPAERVSPNDAGWFPAVAAGEEGSVHVVWQDFHEDPKPEQGGQQQTGGISHRLNTPPLLYSRRVDGTWTKPNDIDLICCGRAARTSLSFDRSGLLHLVYKGAPNPLEPRTMNSIELWHTTVNSSEAERATAWSKRTRITRYEEGYFPAMVVDDQGTIHVIWTEANEGRWSLYYQNSKDSGATWSRRVAIEDSDPVWWYRAQLFVDGRNKLHVAYEALDPKGTYGAFKGAKYAFSLDEGKTWSTVSRSSARQPAVGVDGSGNVLLVYRDAETKRVMYEWSPDGERWSEAADLPGVRLGVDRPYDVYDMATDSAGHVHLALVGIPEDSDSMALLYSEWNGQRWSAPTTVQGAGPYPEYPRLAVSRGNRLHLVWFRGNKASVDRSPIGIWYSTMLTGAPEVTRPVTATPQPTGPAKVDTDDIGQPAASGESARTVRQLAPEPGPRWLTEVRLSRTFPIFAGLAPVVLFLGVVLAAMFVKSLAPRWRPLRRPRG
jgi:hypothetical protein